MGEGLAAKFVHTGGDDAKIARSVRERTKVEIGESKWMN